MVSRTKKLLLTACAMVLFILLTTTMLFSYARTDIGAKASAVDYTWSPSVMRRVSDGNTLSNFENISAPIDVYADSGIGYFVRITDGSSLTQSTFKYCKSSVKLETTDLAMATWFTISKDNRIVINEDGVDVVYLYVEEEANNSFDGYIYFRREYPQTVSGGITQSIIENYPSAIGLTYNVNASDYVPTITRVVSRTANGSEYKDSKWIAGGLNFEITTGSMEEAGGQAFDSKKELLSYSVDNGVNYIPIAGSNKVEIKDKSLVNQIIIFKITNVSGSKVGYWNYGEHTGEYPVNMDPYKPEFTVNAETMDLNGERKEYVNNSWTSKQVSFVLQNISKCCSMVSYSVSVNGGDYTEARELNTFTTTTSAISFKATNQAGTTYEYNTVFNVNIDASVPNVDLGATTTDPDDDAKRKTLSPTQQDDGIISFGFANGDIEIYVYNRNAFGEPVNNASGTVFQYQERMAGVYAGNWRTMTSTVKTSTGETGYVLTASTKEIISVTRTFKFRIKSNAGLVSDEKETTFTLIKSAYLIELGDVSAEINSLGWIADKAVVRVSVPTDSKRSADGNYSEPSTQYSFYYQASNVVGGERSAKGRPVEFHEEKESEIRWWYEFDLVASADSTFIIYAKNSAGKKSANTETTDEKIRIDVIDPVYSMTAFIHPTEEIPKENYVYLDVLNPGWVNGQIVLVLKARVGVSGVYVKEMIYAIDTDTGEILKDENTGEIVWQPRNTQMVVNESVLEKDENGVEWQWQVYRITISIQDQLEEGEKFFIGSREYKYRVYTNSGRHIDVDFTANIDTSDVIALKELGFVSGEKSCDIEIDGESGQRFLDLSDYNFSVCENTDIGFKSSIDRINVKDHYLIKYQMFGGEGKTGDELINMAGSLLDENYITLTAGKKISLDIPKDAIGEIYVAMYIESTAEAFNEERIKAGPYVFKLHYDTKNLVITYELSAEDGGIDVTEQMQGGEWVKGQLRVVVEVKTDDEGGLKIDNSYSFYYMELNTVLEGIPDTGWTKIREGLLTESESAYNYEFILPFLNRGFCGYIAVSVCNGAGYRSKQVASSVVEIKIDNTSPTIDEGIIYNQIQQSGYEEGIRADKGAITVGGKEIEIFTYYSTSEISLRKINDDNRSLITYYYYPIGIEVTELNLNEDLFTELTGSSIGLFGNAGITLSNDSYQMVYYGLYAINSVGTEAIGAEANSGKIELSRVYRFIYDPSKVEGSISYDQNSGHYSEQTDMITYLWKEFIYLYVTGQGTKAPIGEEGYIMYQFSVDNGLNWYNYSDFGVERWYKSGEQVTLTFSPSLLRNYVDKDGNLPFKNGVNTAFTFRSRNKAGATKVYGNVYIAMEDTVPDFEIVTLDNLNLSYYGGEADLTKDPIKWSAGPLTIMINTLTMPASGITYMYYLEYNDGSTIVSTAEEGSYGKKLINYSLFSTDTLDGFNLNRDAVLTITAISNSESQLYKQIKVRISVDQVVPEFALTGQAFRQQSSVSELITSGQWTNKNTVSVSKSVVAKNVSEVEYWYTIKNKDSTAGESAPTRWGDSVGSIERSESCVITVTATSRSGLTYKKEFVINIDATAPIIRFDGGVNVIAGEEYFIDLRVYVEEANIEICEYITIKESTRGFAFAPKGYILSTSSVDNSIRYEKSTGKPYRGYVKVYVKDYAGNEATIDFYVLPFRLTVNNLTLTDEDLAQVDAYEASLAKSRNYMESSRVAYFENLISRLNDRENTLRKEIKGYQDYLEKLYNRSSFELRSDYAEMYKYMQTFNDYKIYGKAWIQDAIIGDSTSKYYAYYQNFLTQFGKLEALMDEVENAEDHIIALPAINMVEREDYEDILRVFDEYKNLTMDQKACFTSNLYNKLMELKEACEVLLLVDEEYGVAINGDFAPGATIAVTEFASSTDTYINVQSLLAKTVSQNAPRTVVSVHRIALDGAYSQTNASDISVTLPISEDYRDYITFAVYELSDDGSMKLINNTEIQPDGKSIRFATEELSTYVLCVKAQMEETETTNETYGTLLGLQLDIKMIKYLIYIGIALFAIVLLVVIILGIRHRKFLNSYNKAYRNSLYRKGVKGIPKGNKQ